MSIKEKMQMGFIKNSMKLMNKGQLQGVYGIIEAYPDTDKDKQEILKMLIHIYKKRGYDIKELIEEK